MKSTVPDNDVGRLGAFRDVHAKKRSEELLRAPAERRVAHAQRLSRVVNRYPVKADTTLGQGELFFDMTSAMGEDAIDGIKVDQRGNVYVSGPGGLWMLDASGKHLGTLRGPEHPHNMAWGDADGRTLYLAAQTGIYRIRLNLAGAGGLAKPAAMTKN